LHDPKPAGKGVIEGIAVSVGNGVEDGKRVAVGKRVCAAFVLITVGEGEGVRTTGCLRVVQAETMKMPIIPKIMSVRFIWLSLLQFLFQDSISLILNYFNLCARSVKVNGMDGITSGRYHFPGSFSTRKLKWR
jgi:hypothetical protein